MSRIGGLRQGSDRDGCIRIELGLRGCQRVIEGDAVGDAVCASLSLVYGRVSCYAEKGGQREQSGPKFIAF